MRPDFQSRPRKAGDPFFAKILTRPGRPREKLEAGMASGLLLVEVLMEA